MKRSQHIVVTGGAGFIGSHITSRLISEGYRVTILDNLSSGKEENIPRGADFIKIDLGEETAYTGLKNLSFDAIFHLAGQSSGEASFIDPHYDFRSHVISTFLLLDCCRKKMVSRFIYASSMSVYGDPDYLPVNEKHPLQPKTFYGAAKISAEAYVKLYQTLGINTTILRLFSVYGPGQNLENRMQGMASIYLSYMLEQVPVIVKGSRKRCRDFVYIDDVVDAWFASFDNSVTYGKVYNVGSGEKTRVADLLETLKISLGYKDYPIEYKEGTPGDQFGVVADITRIRQELKWNSKVNLQAGLNKMVEFERGKLI
ncbi:MAG: NAD-dependent epimerase/dehydratase family protein [Candidatus Omnitrophica bacterium]|nr:NAD-dependent epimerase/dehydratase family protein [Candidatus Omnitrophota bacterium]